MGSLGPLVIFVILLGSAILFNSMESTEEFPERKAKATFVFSALELVFYFLAGVVGFAIAWSARPNDSAVGLGMLIPTWMAYGIFLKKDSVLRNYHLWQKEAEVVRISRIHIENPD